MLQAIITILLSPEADAVLGSELGEATAGRTTQRDGCRHQPRDAADPVTFVAADALHRGGRYLPEPSGHYPARRGYVDRVDRCLI